MNDGAAELAASGYAWEMQDASLLHADLTVVDLAHVAELCTLKVISPPTANRLRVELLALVDTPVSAIDYNPLLGEPYLAREHFLEQRLGSDVGWLRAGRTRREAVRTAQRMALRRLLLELVSSACDTVEALAIQGEAHAGVVAPDHTYLQVAEPTSFGHYLLGFADPVLRDLSRLTMEYDHINLAPTGSGAVAGSEILRDRHGMARRLGFAGAAPHIRDGMWQSDPQTHALLAATTMVIGLDRLAEDLEILTSEEFGLVAIGDGLVRSSVLMPQKRNPYALTVIRGMAGVLIGRATGQLALSKAPSARSDTAIFSYGEVPRGIELATQVTRLMTAVVRTLTVNTDAMWRAASAVPLQATSLADAVMRSDGVDYRTAHAQVGRALAASNGVLTLHALRDEGVRRLSPEEFAMACDPARTVANRDVPGGSSERAVVAEATRVRRSADQIRAWARTHASSVTVTEVDVVESARRAVANGEST